MHLLTAADLPERFATVPELEDLQTRPSEALVEDLLVTPGDIMIVGVTGRMGPLLARLARRASPSREIIGVSQFADPRQAEALRQHGVEPLSCDLLDADAIARLPRVENVIFMAGRRPAGPEPFALTWAMNAYLPALIARHCAAARIVAFSTTEIYPLVEVGRAACDERAVPDPVGEYAQSCLARERLFEHFSVVHGTAGRILRLAHLVETRHGVLFDIAARVRDGAPVSLGAGHVGAIWQGDVAALALRALRHVTTPITPINVGGPEQVSVRWLAEQFGERLGRAPVFSGEEQRHVRAANTAASSALFGYPLVPVARMIDWVADWVARGLPNFGPPVRAEGG